MTAVMIEPLVFSVLFLAMLCGVVAGIRTAVDVFKAPTNAYANTPRSRTMWVVGAIASVVLLPTRALRSRCCGSKRQGPSYRVKERSPGVILGVSVRR